MDGRFSVCLLAVASLALAGCVELPQEDDRRDANEETYEWPDVLEPAGAAACRPLDMDGGFSGGQGAGGQSGVSNTPGSFNYGGQLLLESGTQSYAWQNPSSGATVSWGGQTLIGEFTLRLFDACDELVFEDSVGMLSQRGGFSMPERGTAGEWRIELDFELYTGQMGLSINSA